MKRVLTLQQYQNLWTAPMPRGNAPMPHGFGMPLHTIPCYHQYVQREIYQQDYMDLFTGAITYNRLRNENRFGVPLSKLASGIPHDPSYVDCLPDRNGKPVACLLVDYEYPFSQVELEKGKEKCIKYIMIGEAAPPMTAQLNDGTYFYNVKHTGSTPYFAAPCKAFGISGGDKRQKLSDLAAKGVLLLDLFPFAVPYHTKLRDALNKSGTTDFFWNGNNNPWSIQFRLNELAKSLCQDWDLCMIAPETISTHVLGLPALNLIPISSHHNIWNDLNYDNHGVWMVTQQGLSLQTTAPKSYLKKGKGKGIECKNHVGIVSQNSSVLRLHGNPVTITHLPKRKKFTVLVGNSGPHAAMIANAFDLL